MSDPSTKFLKEAEIEALLLKEPKLKVFWGQHAPLLIFRNRPHAQDPVFEIQLVWDLGDRIETYAWIWVEAWNGQIIRRFPES